MKGLPSKPYKANKNDLLGSSSLNIKESIWKFIERIGWTEDTLDCCRKILQPPNVAKFIFLYNSQYFIYLNKKNII